MVLPERDRRQPESAVMQEFSNERILELAGQALSDTPPIVAGMLGVRPDELPDPGRLTLHVSPDGISDPSLYLESPLYFPAQTLVTLDQAMANPILPGGIRLEQLGHPYSGLFRTDERSITVSRRNLSDIARLFPEYQRDFAVLAVQWSIRKTIGHEYMHDATELPQRIPDRLIPHVLTAAADDLHMLTDRLGRIHMEYTYYAEDGKMVHRSMLLKLLSTMDEQLRMPEARYMYRTEAVGTQIRIWLDGILPDPILVMSMGQQLNEGIVDNVAAMALTNTLHAYRYTLIDKQIINAVLTVSQNSREYAVLNAFFGSPKHMYDVIRDGSLYERLTAELTTEELQTFATSLRAMLQQGDRGIGMMERLLRGHKDNSNGNQEHDTDRKKTKRGRRRSRHS